MDSALLRLSLSVGIIIGVWLLGWVLKRLAKRIGTTQGYATGRVHQIKVLVNSSAVLVSLLSLAAIWGFEQNLVVFASSIFALVGVALFASWSMLSNVTAAVILFSSAPFRLGDRIRLLDGDNTVTGTVRHMGLIYIELQDSDGHLFLLPNNLLLQKTTIRLQKDKELPCDQKHMRS